MNIDIQPILSETAIKGLKDNIDCFNHTAADIDDAVKALEHLLRIPPRQDNKPYENNNFDRDSGALLNDLYEGRFTSGGEQAANVDGFLKKVLRLEGEDSWPEDFTLDTPEGKECDTKGAAPLIINLLKAEGTLPLYDGENNYVHLNLAVDFETLKAESEKWPLDKKWLIYCAAAWQVRNPAAHGNNIGELLEKVSLQKILAGFYLNIAWKHRVTIEKKYADFLVDQGTDFKDYCNRKIQEYETRKKAHYIELDWKRERDSKIIRLKDNTEILKKNRVKILGLAGIGKTEGMRYLHYMACKNFLTEKRIPVYLELNQEKMKKKSITESVAEELGIFLDDAMTLMEEGTIYLYLDGYNEALDDDYREMLHTEINSLVKYEKMFMVVSDRGRDTTLGVLNDGADTLELMPLSEEAIIELIKTHARYFCVREDSTLDEEEYRRVMEKLIIVSDGTEHISNEARWLVNFNKDTTPLKISRLVELVKAEGVVPKRKEFATKYLLHLFKREKDKGEKELTRICMFLSYIADLDDDERTRIKRMDHVADRMKEKGYFNDSRGDRRDEVAKLMANMGIYGKGENGYYDFCEPEYQQFFANGDWEGKV